MTRRVLVPALLAVLTGGGILWAADEAAKKADSKPMNESALKEDSAIKQERLAIQFRDFEQKLLRLAQRLELSSKPEDREKALVLKKAIKIASESQTENKFDKLISVLKDSKTLDLDTVATLMQQNKDLAKDLRAILDALLTDNREAELRAERERIQNLLKMLNEVIRAQQMVRAWTERGGKSKEELRQAQEAVTRATEALAKAIERGKGGDAGKESKGDAKGSDKGGEGKKGDGKDDTKEKKILEKEKKDDPAAKPEAKDGDKKGDQGGAKSAGKQGEGDKAGSKSGKPEAKDGQKPSESKGKGDNKGEAKSGQSGDKQQAQSGQPKPGAQSGQQQPGEQGQGKKDKQDDDQQQGNKNTPGKQQVQDAIGDQHKAENNIAKDKKPEASENQDDAIKKLKEAQKKLEELLAQLRQEELERLLAALQARCERMLQMQIEVKAGTVDVYKTIEQSPNKKPERAEVQKALALSDREMEIVREADKAIGILQAEGSAVAFPEVFTQVRSDMKQIADWLHLTETGVITQTTEQDVIDTLKEMIEALKKARKDNQEKGKQGQAGPPQDQKLIDLLAELKMIRSMQVRVNNRTKTYAEQFPNAEQVPPLGTVTGQEREKADLALKAMKELADRQQKIFDVVNNMYRGKNEGGRP